MVPVIDSTKTMGIVSLLAPSRLFTPQMQLRRLG